MKASRARPDHADKDRGRRHLRPAGTAHPAGGIGPVGSIVHVTINGERRDLPGPLTVAELLRHLAVKPEYVAVELNKELVTRSRQAETAIAPGDVLEIVTLVGGGSPAAALGISRAGTRAEPLTIGTHLVQQPAVRRHGQVRDARADARLPGGQRRRGGDRRRPPRAARSTARGAASWTSSTPGDTPSCPTRPAASRPRTPCAPPGWAASCSRAWTTPAPTG